MKAKAIDLEENIGAVCDVFGTTREELMSRDRHRRIADARMCLYLLSVEQGNSTKSTAHAIGRTRGNVLLCIKSIQGVAETDGELHSKIEQVRNILNSKKKL